MSAYYNENDPKAAAWLRELIKAGAIALGEVDERDIQDVRPDELAGYTQCHFFAGIGAWSYALRLGGWPDDRPVWTGSCPCQPFSAAGKGGGLTDERHLWPAWFHLIQQRRPVTIFGEQVSSPDGLAWLDVVRPDLESETYAVGCADLCAAGVGAPEIRQRIFFVADDAHGRDAGAEGLQRGGQQRQFAENCVASNVAKPDQHGCEMRRERLSPVSHGAAAESNSSTSVVVDSAESGLALGVDSEDARGIVGHEGRPVGDSSVNGHWAGADWIYCRDEKWRPVEPGTFPLVNGAPARVVRLRGYGNAIVAPLAATFIKAYMSAST